MASAPPRGRGASRASRVRRIASACCDHALAWPASARPRGHEVVAGVAVGDVDEVALAADGLDVVAQHDLHRSPRPRSVDCAPAPRPRRRPRSTAPSGAAAPAARPRPGAGRRGPCAAGRHPWAARRAGLGAVRSRRGRRACRPCALRDLADAVGQQRHLAGERIARATSRCCWAVLPGDAAGADLGPLRHEAAQQVDVLVVDPVDARRSCWIDTFFFDRPGRRSAAAAAPCVRRSRPSPSH